MDSGTLWFVGFLALAFAVGVVANVIEQREDIADWWRTRWKIWSLQFKQWRASHRRTARQKVMDLLGQ